MGHGVVTFMSLVGYSICSLRRLEAVLKDQANDAWYGNLCLLHGAFN